MKENVYLLHVNAPSGAIIAFQAGAFRWLQNETPEFEIRSDRIRQFIRCSLPFINFPNIKQFGVVKLLTDTRISNYVQPVNEITKKKSNKLQFWL